MRDTAFCEDLNDPTLNTIAWLREKRIKLSLWDDEPLNK